MKCKYCGAEIANDSVYCEQCGKFTNPFNKKGVTCSMSLVKWLLFGTMAVLCLVSPALASLSYYYVWNNDFWTDFLFWLWFWAYPIIPLAILVLCLVLTIKKKLAIAFTVVTFLLGITMITEWFLTGFDFSAGRWNSWVYFDMVLIFRTIKFRTIQAGILLLYIIYDIIAAAIARKRIRRG